MLRAKVIAYAILLIAVAATGLAAIKVSYSAFYLDGVAYGSRDACIEAAKTALGETPLVCVQNITVTGNCSDVPKPVIEDAEGFTYVGTRAALLCPGSETAYCDTETDYVPAPFPTCWREEARPVPPPEALALEYDDPADPWPIEAVPISEPGTPSVFE